MNKSDIKAYFENQGKDVIKYGNEVMTDAHQKGYAHVAGFGDYLVAELRKKAGMTDNKEFFEFCVEKHKQYTEYLRETKAKLGIKND